MTHRFLTAFVFLLYIALPLKATFSVSAYAQATIKIDGSTGVLPLVKALSDAYSGKNKGVAITFGNGLGTKARIEALKSGTIDVAMASHGLNVEDLTRQGFTVTEIARTPVVFATHADTPVTNLTEAQVCGIYTGKIGNWKEIGGPDLAIAARTRPDSEVDAEVMRGGIGCFKSLQMATSVKEVGLAGEMAAELAGSEGAIGMTTTTLVEQSGGKIRAVALNGITADEPNVTAGKYKLIREAFLVTATPTPPAAAELLAFIASPEGSTVIRANGAIATKNP